MIKDQFIAYFFFPPSLCWYEKQLYKRKESHVHFHPHEARRAAAFLRNLSHSLRVVLSSFQDAADPELSWPWSGEYWPIEFSIILPPPTPEIGAK